MIHDKEPLVNAYISVPRDFGSLNCAAFVAGAVHGMLDAGPRPPPLAAPAHPARSPPPPLHQPIPPPPVPSILIVAAAAAAVADPDRRTHIAAALFYGHEECPCGA